MAPLAGFKTFSYFFKLQLSILSIGLKCIWIQSGARIQKRSLTESMQLLIWVFCLFKGMYSVNGTFDSFTLGNRFWFSSNRLMLIETMERNSESAKTTENNNLFFLRWFISTSKINFSSRHQCLIVIQLS